MQLSLHATRRTPHVSLRAWCKQCLPGGRRKPDVLRAGIVYRDGHTTTATHGSEPTTHQPRPRLPSLYNSLVPAMMIQEKMDIVCKEMYRAKGAEWSEEAEEKVAFYERAGYGKVRRCRVLHVLPVYFVLIECLRFTKILLSWKTYLVSMIMKPTNSPTQGQPNPRKNRFKVAFWTTFSQQIFFRGLGLVLYRKQTTRNPT